MAQPVEVFGCAPSPQAPAPRVPPQPGQLLSAASMASAWYRHTPVPNEAAAIARYERAVELLRSEVAAVTTQLDQAEGAGAPTDGLFEKQRQLMRRRRQLKIEDARTVDEVLREFSPRD
jgi:hypothetical protein